MVPPYSSQPPQVEREEPSVARKGRWHVAGMILLGLVGIMAIGAMVYTELSEEDSAASQKPNDEVSVIRARNNSKPYIAPADSAPKTPPPSKKHTAPPSSRPPSANQQMQLLMQKEAYRQMKRSEQEQLERIQSPQLIYDSPATRPGTGSPAAPAAMGTAPQGTLAGLPEKNASSADNGFPSISGSGSNKVGAEQLTELYGLITQGTLISGIMETAISSNLPGMTRAIVTEDVYSFNKQNLLIPTGSMLVGQYRSAVQQGQSRVFIIWNRLIRPDGVSIRLASYSTDSLGRSGAEGDVDTHFWERFGSSVMLSLIDAGAQIAAQSANESNTNIALNTSDGLSRASEIALENSINIPPTIHIAQGERIKVLVGQDLDFSTVRKTAWHE